MTRTVNMLADSVACPQSEPTQGGDTEKLLRSTRLAPLLDTPNTCAFQIHNGAVHFIVRDPSGVELYRLTPSEFELHLAKQHELWRRVGDQLDANKAISRNDNARLGRDHYEPVEPLDELIHQESSACSADLFEKVRGIIRTMKPLHVRAVANWHLLDGNTLEATANRLRIKGKVPTVPTVQGYKNAAIRKLQKSLSEADYHAWRELNADEPESQPNIYSDSSRVVRERPRQKLSVQRRKTPTFDEYVNSLPLDEQRIIFDAQAKFLADRSVKLYQLQRKMAEHIACGRDSGDGVPARHSGGGIADLSDGLRITGKRGAQLSKKDLNKGTRTATNVFPSKIDQ
jgi:hypothetical protein